MHLESTVADWYDRNSPGEDDHYSQPGMLFRKALNEEGRKNLIKNIAGAMKGISGSKKDLIINRQLCHFFRADINLGLGVAVGLGIEVDKMPMQHEVTA